VDVEELAVALKIAVVAPEATRTEGDTVSRALLLASVTVVPPAGAAKLKVTVQLEAVLGYRVAGLQTTDEMLGMATIALVPRMARLLPAGLTANGLVRAIAVVPALGASVT